MLPPVVDEMPVAEGGFALAHLSPGGTLFGPEDR